MLTVDDYKEKIKKLLALAQSPSEAEAKAALLKARKLMAEYKLTEADLKEAEEQPVKDILTDITCSKRRDPWIVNLSTIIGRNYCCQGYIRRNKHKQTILIGFIGLENDVEVCVRFLYKGIIIKHNKTEPTYTKTSLFLCEKRRFFMARTEKGVVATI